VVYTCPAGYTAIVKDVRLSSPVGTVTRAVAAVLSGATQVSLLDSPLGTGETFRLGFTVLEPGDQLVIFAAGSTVAYYISGAELYGVAP